MVFIYVLQLTQDKFYIGKTDNPKFRINSHFKKGGCAWTKKYNPTQIIGLFPDCDDFDEDKYTLKYMSKYGIDNVRGGSFCQTNLSSENKKMIERMITGSNDCCHFCGEKGHFIGKCPNKKIKKEYSKQNNHFLELSKDYESADEVEWEEESDDEGKAWSCSYCNKSFDTKKGAQFHENIHCKVKKQYEESEESDEELTIDNLEQTFAQADKDSGVYLFDGDKYLWDNDELYEESPHDNCGARDGTFYDSNYDDNCWRPIKKRKKKSTRKGDCHKCGRHGHYASKCYAKKHINGSYL